MLGKPWKTCLPPIVPWLVATAAVILATRGAQPIPSALHTPLWQRPLIAADALGFYAGKLMWPARLGIDYGHRPSLMPHSTWAYADWLIAAAVLIGVWRVRRSTPMLAAGGAIFVCGLLPNLGLIPFVFEMMSTTADRYAYPGMLGAALALAGFVSQSQNAAASVDSKHPRLQAPHPASGRGISTLRLLSIAAALTVCIALSAAQVRAWRDSATLFGRAIAVNPRSFVSCNNLGNMYQNEGDDALARGLYLKAIQIEPNFAMPYANLASLAWQAGRNERAIALFHLAIEKDPDCAVAHSGLGIELMTRHDDIGALREWTAAARLAPDSALVRYELGITLRRLGREPEADAQFHAALDLQPSFDRPRLALADIKVR